MSSERFFLTERDHQPMGDPLEPERHCRTYSDPFDIIPSRRSSSLERKGIRHDEAFGFGINVLASIRTGVVVSRSKDSKEGHVRSKSEESPSDMSQFSYVKPTFSPTDRRAARYHHALVFYWNRMADFHGSTV
ncbi:hypothetical protein DPMN_156819 [Dreissena polymorpha]|uniref:Uncharacterized protein n=1 Tax=Dreissena polymorpha TaxID=45954 RepID=A0A9D4FWB7_DREPO|nr:hypothetical protein DPMN_156819 [Dreissena polymorpha]